MPVEGTEQEPRARARDEVVTELWLGPRLEPSSPSGGEHRSREPLEVVGVTPPTFDI